MHGAGWGALARLEDVLLQPRAGDRRHWSVCGSDSDLVRLFAFLVLGHGRRQLLWFEVTPPSDGGVAGPPDHRGVSLGLSTGLPGTRQRPGLRTRVQHG